MPTPSLTKYVSNRYRTEDEKATRISLIIAIVSIVISICASLFSVYAVKVLLNAIDVKCIVVTGTAGKNGNMRPHAWNLVNIDEVSYQLDVTWDMGKSTGDKISYEYFNLSDECIVKNHSADCKLPECGSRDKTKMESEL